MVAWVEADEMPPCPMSEKANGTVSPRWPHAHQAKVAYLDLEFLHFKVDPSLITEVCVWRAEEPAPVSWMVRPPPSYLDQIERTDAKKWHMIQKAAEVNGFTVEEWKDAPHWHDVRESIAKAVFGRILVGVNIYAADIRRLAAMFHPHDLGWIMPHSSIDLQHLAKIAGLPRTNLEALCEHYGIEKETVHRAEGGVRRVRAVAEAMLRRP